MRAPGAWTSRPRWWVGLSAAAVAAVSLAGLWGIAVARKGVAEQSASLLRLHVAARAKSIESLLSSTRADLAFLAGSPDFFSLEAGLASPDPREARWRRLGAEGALLLFLRGHPEVAHLAVRAAGGRPLVEAGRRGGVPVLWRASSQPEEPRAGLQLVSEAVVEGVAAGSTGASLRARLDPAMALAHGVAGAERTAGCELFDSSGAILAGGATAAPGTLPEAPVARAEAAVRAEGWSAPSPWRLSCEQAPGEAAAFLVPLERSYRLTLTLNLVVMSLTLLLGSFAIQQVRRRERLEAEAGQEARLREVERQLFHSERLSTVGRLAAGMAHEINNPLEGMANYLSLAGQAVARGDAEAAERHLGKVREGLERVTSVVRQVLQHADPARAPMQSVEINSLLSRTVEFVRTRREFGNLRFDLSLAEPMPAARANQVMLGQVFLNLLLNACEAQPRGGEVVVRTSTANGRILIEVADRGPGVPAHAAEKIFEPFYSTKQSSGLGLSICHSIVAQHDGEIRLRPRPGGGALFEIGLPVPVPERGGKT